MKKISILSLALSLATVVFSQADTADANKFVKGLPEGKWIVYHNIDDGKEIGAENKKGSFYSVTMYNAGKRSGTVKEYYITGELWSETQYAADWKTVVWKEYFANGKLMVKDSIMDNKGNGMIETYYGDGKLNLKFPYSIDINGETKITLISPEGSALVLVGFVNGEVKQYDDNTGNIKMAWLFKYDMSQTSKFTLEGAEKVWTLVIRGIKGSTVKTYSDKGIIQSEVPSLDGHMHGDKKDYYDDGTLKSELIYAHGGLNGICKTYDKDGKIATETPYIDGRITGVVKQYYPNGVVQTKTMYYENNPQGDPEVRDVDGNIIK